MKKLLQIVVLVTAVGNAFAQDCSQFFISKYMRGRGNTKCIELYNPTANPINLSGYFLQRLSAAGGTGSIPALTNSVISATTNNTLALSGTIQPFSTFLIVNGQTTSTPTSPSCDPNLQAIANQLDLEYNAPGTGVGKPTYFKGNDPVFIKDAAGNIVDLFGEAGVSVITAWSAIAPYRGAAGMGKWITNNYLMVRKPTVKRGVITNPPDFNPLAEYDTIPGLYAPNNTNSDSSLLYGNFGAHVCDCSTLTSIRKIGNDKIGIMPNPANEMVTINSTFVIENAKVYSTMGTLVYESKEINKNELIISTSDYKQGVYILQLVGKNGKLTTQRFTVFHN